MTDEELQRYLAAVEKVRSARADAIDASTRQKIAEELGVSSSDLAAAASAGEAALARGEGLLARGAWDEAITNLNDADALLPDDLRVTFALARASLGRHRAGGGDADRDRALTLCRRCLEIDPRHEGATAMIGAIEAARPRGRGRRIVLAVAGVIVLGGAGVVLLSLRSTPPRPLCPHGRSDCSLPAPVVMGDLGDGVELAPAMLHVSSRGLRLDLTGRLTHRGLTELELLRLGVRLLDGEGREVGRLAVDAQQTFTPPLRPGDSRTFLLSEIVPPTTRRVALLVDERREQRAPEAYGEALPLPVVFESPAPSHIVVRASFRSRSVRRSGDHMILEGVVAVENGGQGVIRTLDVALQGLDAAGKPVGKPSRSTIAYPVMPPMLAGEKRTIKVLLYLTEDVVAEELIVIKST